MTPEQREALYLNQCSVTKGEHEWREGGARDHGRYSCARCMTCLSVSWLIHCEKKWRLEALALNGQRSDSAKTKIDTTGAPTPPCGNCPHPDIEQRHFHLTSMRWCIRCGAFYTGDEWIAPKLAVRHCNVYGCRSCKA